MASDFHDQVKQALESLRNTAEKALQSEKPLAFLRLGLHTTESQAVVDTVIEANQEEIKTFATLPLLRSFPIMFPKRPKDGGSPGGEGDKILMLLALEDLSAENGLVDWGSSITSIKAGGWVQFSDGLPLLFTRPGGGLAIVIELTARKE